MELVQSLGYKITLLPANLAWLGSYTEDLQRRGIEVIHAPFVLSQKQLLEERGHEFDLIYVTRYTIAAESLPLIRKHAPQARLLFCNADLHYLRQLRAAKAQLLEGDEASRALEAVKEVKQRELQVMREVDLTLSYSAVERAVIEAETLGEAPTAPCPWVVEAPTSPAPLSGRSGLAFLGSYNHPPNHDAVGAFLEQIWPEIQQQQPDLLFHIYGSGLTQELADTWQSIQGVRVEGWVADAGMVYNKHRVFIVPLRSGAGIKGKVIAAAAHGIPQVLSPLAAESTGLRHGFEAIIAGSPDQWVSSIFQLCMEDDAWQDMSTAAHQFVCEHYSRSRGLGLMRDALHRLELPTRSLP
jgi:glycosyltransferase involved in cell wall biosynthesis